MDDLTARILALDQDFEDHPAKYTMILHCPQCGADRLATYKAEEVARWRSEHNGSSQITAWCEKCAPAEKETE